MSTADSERRVRDEIVSVLDEFGLTYEFGHTNKHASISFDVAGKKLKFAYGGGDPRAHLNARSDVRRILLQSGVQPIPEEKKLPKVSLPPPPLEIPEKEVLVAEVTEPEPVVVERETPPAPQVEEPPPLRLNPEDGYLVYQARNLVPNRCLVIELEKDMLLERGSVVIIPLYRPSLVPMSKELFEAMFSVETQAPVDVPVHVPTHPIPPPPPPRDDDDDDEPPEQHHHAVEESNNTDYQHVTGYVRKKPTPAEKVRRVNVVPTSYRKYAPRRIDDVTPQTGRILAALLHLSDSTHQAEHEPGDLFPYMFEHDRKQISSRIPGAVSAGYVERGSHLPGRVGKHLKITAKGRKIVRKIKEWPWRYDGLEPPPWAEGSAAQSAE